MHRSTRPFPMFIRNVLRRLKFLKSIAVILVCTLIINLYLLYRLRSDSYPRGKILTSRDEQTVPDTKKSNSIRSTHAPAKRACRVGNHSKFMSDLLLRLRKDTGVFSSYYVSNSSSLQSRCLQFLSDEYFMDENHLILTDHEIDFANKKLITMLQESQVVRVRNAPKGSQLKLLVHLSNRMIAIFKPRWYFQDDVINGTVYSGKDRHHGEVIAFYMSILMNLTRVAPSVIRSLDVLTEIKSVADSALLDTFVSKGNETCFYGVCHYCNIRNLLCTTTGSVEGSLSYYLSLEFELKVVRHPWHRTYRCNSLARWEWDPNFCRTVLDSDFYSAKKNRALFLDLMDVAIFDFLIDNGDRHRYEYTTNLKVPRILIVDNGKSFGNPYSDHIDILAPLYQCCVLRESTWSNLLLLRKGELTRWLKFLLEQSDGRVQLNELHFRAIERRLVIVFAAMKYCFEKSGIENVLVFE